MSFSSPLALAFTWAGASVAVADTGEQANRKTRAQLNKKVVTR